MDPRYRPINPHDHPHIPNFLPPNCYNLTDQSHGVGFMSMGPDYRWHPNGNGRSDYPHPLPQDIREAVLREVEKERIREEIIMSEIMRRRVLEAEVRREVTMDRKMPLFQGGYGFPFGSAPVIGSEPPTSPSLLASKAGCSAEETLGMALGDKEKLKRGENSGLETLPFQKGADDLSISEFKPASMGNKEKERTPLLPKKDENVSGSNTKDVTTSSEMVNFELLADAIASKIAKEEGSCALCQVMITSRKDLNEHVTGKKHKSKVAAMRAQIHMEEEQVKLKAQSGKSGEANATSGQDNLPLLENPQSEHSKKTQAEVIREVQKNEDDLRKNVQKNDNDPRKKGCEFWCELCQVGTLSIEVMNAHKLGKKHVRRSKCEPYGGTDSFNQTKSFVLDDPMEDVYGNEKSINLGKLNQALDEVSSEDSMLIDEVKKEEREEKSLDSEVVNIELPEMVNNELPADVVASKKFKECSSALCQVHGEWEERTSACHVVNSEFPEVVNFELPDDVDVDADKKSKEWRCALCRVICTRKKDLDEHVLGKKHKSNEGSLRAQTTGENYCVKPFPKKPTKLIYVEKVGVKLTAQPLSSGKAWQTLKKVDFPLLESQQSENLANTQAVVIPKVQKNDDDPWKEVQKNKNDPLDDVSSVNCVLLNEINQEEREGKSLDSEVINIELLEMVNNELPADVTASEKSKEECSSALCQVHGEWEGRASACNWVNIENPEVVNFEVPADVYADKKSKEWRCALCQVICTRKKDLDEHLLGKKHKSNEASLRAQTTGENCSIKPFPKKATKLIYVEKARVKLTAQALSSEKTWQTTSNKDDLPLLENQQSENLANTQAVVIQKVQKNDDDPWKELQMNINDPRRKDCEFRCELCQVGTLSSEVMNAHKLGKKHIRRSRCEQYGGTDSFNQNKSSVFVDHVEDLSRNIKNINLGKLNQTLDDISSEDCMQLVEVDHDLRQRKSLDFEVVNIELPEGANNKLPADVTVSKKSKEACRSTLRQVHGQRNRKTSLCKVVNRELPKVVNFELPANADKKSKGSSRIFCHFICNKEKYLDEHALGKKRNSKMAVLSAQTTGKNYSTGPFPKKTTKSINVVKEGVKVKAQSLFTKKVKAISKKDNLLLLGNPQSEKLAKTRSQVIRKVKKNKNGPRKKNCEFWCELCQVGTQSIEVMNAHILGKKHVRRSRCEQYDGTDTFNQNMSYISGNTKNIKLGKVSLALDEVTSEDHTLLDTVRQEAQQGKTLDSEVVDTEHPADITANKKSKEWSCALCQISATCEKGLNEHLLGKKHKSKEAAVRSS